jgi:16S rRNA (uracil1498-N3)-methyltransferase
MNLLLLHSEDFESGPPAGAEEAIVRIDGRRLQHVRGVHRAAEGDELRVGVLGGSIGTGRIRALSDDHLELAVRLDREPPEPLNVALVVALPRPLVLKRVLLHATSLGVKRIALIHSNRVEKSYWQSGAASPEALNEQLLLGLEQAGDTVLPKLTLHRRFRPFVEDELSGLLTDSQGLVAHPEAKQDCPRGVEGPVTLAIGPEGGFVPFEIERFVDRGFLPVRLGARVLRVEAAVPFAIARLG